MKKRFLIFLAGITFLGFWMFSIETAEAQEKSGFETILTNISPNPGMKKVPQMIEDWKLMNAKFERRELFEQNANLIAEGDHLSKQVSEGVKFDLNKAAVRRILQESPNFLILPIPDGKGGTIELELAKVNIFAPGFNVKTSAPTDESYERHYGLHYRGMIKGEPISLAAVSIFEHEVMGSIRSKTLGNSVLGRLQGENRTDRHIFYDDQYLTARPEHFCKVKDSMGESLPLFMPSEQLDEAVMMRTVKKYIEINFDVFQNKGSVGAAISYITGFFNQSAALYANDGIFISLQETFVWNTPSPYTGTSSIEDETIFVATRPTFNGNLAHLITLKPYGGIATLDALCSTGDRHAVSGVGDTFENVPTYSWTVNVFTHETGHNLGSRHTHACVWNGNDTAIDSCSAVEGECASPGFPAGGGTIMSYCHLQKGVGIDFTQGFGAQPKAFIQSRINAAACLTNSTRTQYDFDGDNKTDISIFRPSAGEWWYLRSSDGSNRAFQFGAGTDTLVPADYTGDGKTDVAIWRPASGEWFVLRSEDNSFYSFPFGVSTDIPTPADFDGDGRSDPAVFRPSTGNWFILNSGGGTTITTFGGATDKPVAADYDGDGKADLAIYRPAVGQWWINRSTAGLIVLTFGSSTDKTVQGDYTGDGKADVAFWRPSTGEWFFLRSEDFSFYSFPFGTAGDIPIPGDYDGDGKADAAIFRPSANTWYINGSTSGTQIVGFGAAGDQPVPNSYVR